MQLDCRIFVFKINSFNACRIHQPFELLQKITSGLCAQVGIINLGGCHSINILSCYRIVFIISYHAKKCKHDFHIFRR